VREAVVVCPAEVTAPIAAAPAPEADAVVETNPAGRRWLAATIAWGEGLAARLTDARGQCPPVEGERQP
jgi:hypothetical protein